jgi:hypothetical protein
MLLAYTQFSEPQETISFTSFCCHTTVPVPCKNLDLGYSTLSHDQIYGGEFHPSLHGLHPVPTGNTGESANGSQGHDGIFSIFAGERRTETSTREGIEMPKM